MKALLRNWTVERDQQDYARSYLRHFEKTRPGEQVLNVRTQTLKPVPAFAEA